MVFEIRVCCGSNSTPKIKGPANAYIIRTDNPVIKRYISHLINLPIKFVSLQYNLSFII